MPRSSYYSGHGRKVFSRMIRQYGRAKGEEVFYRTANKRGEAPKRRRRVRRKR
jgi:hypothetical protein